MLFSAATFALLAALTTRTQGRVLPDKVDFSVKVGAPNVVKVAPLDVEDLIPEDAMYAATLPGSGKRSNLSDSELTMLTLLSNESLAVDAADAADAEEGTDMLLPPPPRALLSSRALVVSAALAALVAFLVCARKWTAEAVAKFPPLQQHPQQQQRRANDLDETVPAEGAEKLKVLLLMSDTGGGHRASAQAIVGALEKLHPGCFDADIYDIWTDAAPWPLNQLVPMYRWLGANPFWWGAVWYSTAAPGCKATNRFGLQAVREPFTRAIAAKNPDLVVSVHPMCQEEGLTATRALRAARPGRAVPFATVVTDLGSAHPTWFDERADACFVPGDVVAALAARHGVPADRVVQHGLPLRDAFKEHADAVAADAAAVVATNAASDTDAVAVLDASCKPARRAALGAAFPERPAALIVGGGEGMGGLGAIVDAVWRELDATRALEATLFIVCGKNAALQKELAARAWGERVDVVVLGFVKNMHDYMAACDCILTKAGPGTIAEAATMGLPTLLTSHLPGQEAGNVTYVIEGGFGAFETAPAAIARTLGGWLRDPSALARMRVNARKAANPSATHDIARDLAKMVMQV